MVTGVGKGRVFKEKEPVSPKMFEQLTSMPPSLCLLSLPFFHIKSRCCFLDQNLRIQMETGTL